MCWNKIDLPVEQIYGKLDLGFMPIFNKAIKVFKDCGYEKILDLGCGYGKHSIYLSQNDFNVTSIDISKQAIEWLEKYIDANHVGNIVNVKMNFNTFANIIFNTSVNYHFGLLVIILSLILYDLPVIFSTLE